MAFLNTWSQSQSLTFLVDILLKIIVMTRGTDVLFMQTSSTIFHNEILVFVTIINLLYGLCFNIPKIKRTIKIRIATSYTAIRKNKKIFSFQSIAFGNPLINSITHAAFKGS